MSFRRELARAALPLARLAGSVPLPSLGRAAMNLGLSLPPENNDYQQAFKLVPTVQFCVESYQTAISATPLRFYIGDGDNKVEIERKPGNIVDLWHNANSEDTGLDLIEQIVGSLELQGNAYLFKDYLGSPLPKQFWCLNPLEVSPIVAKNGRGVLGYKIGQIGAAIEVPRQQIVHFKRYDPNLGVVGLSRIASLALAYETQRDAARYMRAFYRRGGTIAGHYSTEQSLDPDEIEALKRDLNERVAGPEHAWEPVILPRKLKYERAGLTFAEMQFVESLKITTEQMLAIFRIHPILASQAVATGLSSEVAATAMLMFLRFGIIPEATRISRTINEKFLATGEFGPDVSCEFDFSNDPVLVGAWLDQAKAWVAACGAPVAFRSEARDKLGLQPREDEFPELDEPLVPINMSPEGGGADTTPAPTSTANPAGSTDGAAISEARLEGMLGVRLSREQMKKRADRLLRIEERRFRAETIRMLRRQKRRVVAGLIAQGPKGRAYDLDALVATLDDPEDRRRAKKLIRSIVESRGEAAVAELGLDVAFDMTRRVVEEFIAEKAAAYVSNVNKTTRERLRESLVEGVAADETIGELTARVDDVFDGRRGNAETIARTETTPAFNFASKEAWSQSGVVGEKEWLTAGDDAVRDDHAAADGQRVALDDSFTVGGEALDFPGDPNGSVSNIANCRCTMVPVLSSVSGEESAPLPKRIAERMGTTKTNGNGAHKLTVEEWLDAELSGK